MPSTEAAGEVKGASLTGAGGWRQHAGGLAVPPQHLALALIANLAWAFNWVAGKYGTEQFPPLLFTALRFSLLLLLLLPCLRPVPGRMVQVLQVATVLGVVHFGLIFVGISVSGDISSVAIASQLYVPLSAALAALVLKEKLGWARALGIGVALSGVLLIGFDPNVIQHLDALAFVTAAAAALAVATILMRRLPGVGVLTMQAWIAAVAAPGMWLLTVLLERGQLTALQQATWLDYAAPTYSAVGSSLVGHGIVYWLLGRHPVALISTLMLLAPVLAVVLGVWLWGDQLSWELVLGGVLTLAGVAAVLARPRGPRPSGSGAGQQ